MAAGLLSEGDRWNAPRAEATVSAGTVSFIPGPLAIRRLLYSNDSFHSFSPAEFSSAYLTLGCSVALLPVKAREYECSDI